MYNKIVLFPKNHNTNKKNVLKKDLYTNYGNKSLSVLATCLYQ